MSFRNGADPRENPAHAVIADVMENRETGVGHAHRKAFLRSPKSAFSKVHRVRQPIVAPGRSQLFRFMTLLPPVILVEGTKM
jgi:hypothetical protein